MIRIQSALSSTAAPWAWCDGLRDHSTCLPAERTLILTPSTHALLQGVACCAHRGEHRWSPLLHIHGCRPHRLHCPQVLPRRHQHQPARNHQVTHITHCNALTRSPFPLGLGKVVPLTSTHTCMYFYNQRHVFVTPGSQATCLQRECCGFWATSAMCDCWACGR